LPSTWASCRSIYFPGHLFISRISWTPLLGIMRDHLVRRIPEPAQSSVERVFRNGTITVNSGREYESSIARDLVQLFQYAEGLPT